MRSQCVRLYGLGCCFIAAFWGTAFEILLPLCKEDGKMSLYERQLIYFSHHPFPLFSYLSVALWCKINTNLLFRSNRNNTSTLVLNYFGERGEGGEMSFLEVFRWWHAKSPVFCYVSVPVSEGMIKMCDQMPWLIIGGCWKAAQFDLYFV